MCVGFRTALMHLRHLIKGAGAPEHCCGTQRACSTLIQSLLWFRISNHSLSSLSLCFSVPPPWLAVFISFYRITFSNYLPSLVSFLYLLKAFWSSCMLKKSDIEKPCKRRAWSGMRVGSQKLFRDRKRKKHLLSTDWWITYYYSICRLRKTAPSACRCNLKGITHHSSEAPNHFRCKNTLC